MSQLDQDLPTQSSPQDTYHNNISRRYALADKAAAEMVVDGNYNN
jgi:hypothetical protein